MRTAEQRTLHLKKMTVNQRVFASLLSLVELGDYETNRHVPCLPKVLASREHSLAVVLFVSGNCCAMALD